MHLPQIEPHPTGTANCSVFMIYTILIWLLVFGIPAENTIKS